MPDNPSPTAKSDPSAEPIEFNFDQPDTEIPRIKRRSLKGKNQGLKPATSVVPARELEREAPPLTAEEAARPAAPRPEAKEVRPAAPPRTTPVAPPKTTPVVASAAAAKPAVTHTATATTQRPASTTPAPATPAVKNSTTPSAPAVAVPANGDSSTGHKVNISLTSQQKATAAVLAASAAKSPHGTRPATLYYTSQPKKEATDSMKTTTTASPSSAAPTSSSTSASSASTTRPASTGATSPAASPAVSSASRPASSAFDYRANVERQNREQKSVGSILAYFVYGLIALFVIGAILAGYGAYIINRQLHDQSTSISSLDDKYAAKVADLNKQLITTQDTLTEAQAQLARQQDLLTRQEEEISQLRTALSAVSSASGEAIHAEARARAQEAAVLRARIRDLEYKTTTETLARP